MRSITVVIVLLFSFGLFAKSRFPTETPPQLDSLPDVQCIFFGKYDSDSLFGDGKSIYDFSVDPNKRLGMTGISMKQFACPSVKGISPQGCYIAEMITDIKGEDSYLLRRVILKRSTLEEEKKYGIVELEPFDFEDTKLWFTVSYELTGKNALDKSFNGEIKRLFENNNMTLSVKVAAHPANFLISIKTRIVADLFPSLQVDSDSSGYSLLESHNEYGKNFACALKSEN